MNEFTTEDYKKFKQEKNLKVHGWFLFGKPALSINDVDIIKQIQVLFRICESFEINSFEVKDFNHFVDRNEANFGKSFGGAKLDKVFSLSDLFNLVDFICAAMGPYPGQC